MTRIVLLSDLHFGYHREVLVGPLLALVNRARADLVVVTGDLTHRGRPGQFAQAAEFLSRITVPVLAVPGNHDVPLYNIPVRFLLPYSGYRQTISTDLSPTRAVGGVRVLGMNSVDPFTWQRGRLRPTDVERVAASLDPLATNIVALHHPLEHLPEIDKELSLGAEAARARLESAGAQIVLSGHLHIWAAEALLRRANNPRLLQIQAGTALCARPGDRQNEVAVLSVDGTELVVARHVAPMDEAGFQPPRVSRFSRASGDWRLIGQSAPTLPGATERAFSTA